MVASPSDSNVRRRPAAAAKVSAERALTPRDRIVVRAMAEAMVSQDADVAAATLDAHLDEIDLLLRSASTFVRVGLRIALTILRFSPILLRMRLRLLDRLSIDERVAVLTRLERSSLVNLSLAFIGWRTLITLIVYESPKELAMAGYTDERNVYRRHLPTHAPDTIPPPAQSGVRLRDPAAAVEEADGSSRDVA